MARTPTPYPSDLDDDAWAFVAPYVTRMRLDAPQRKHDLRSVMNALLWVVRTGSPWRYLPHDFPPWQAVYQQGQRWLKAGVFEDMAHDLRELIRLAQGKAAEPSAVMIDGRTMRSTPESGSRAGYDGYKRTKGSKVHIAVDTLGFLLAARVTPANEQERNQVGELTRAVQAATGQAVEVAYVDQGYTGEQPKQDAAEHGIDLCVIKLPQAKNGFVLLPKRWVVERSFAWASRFRRLARDYERLPQTLAGMHFLAFIALMLARLPETLRWLGQSA